MSKAYVELEAEIRKDIDALYSRRQTLSDELGKRLHRSPADRYPTLSLEELANLLRIIDRCMSGR